MLNPVRYSTVQYILWDPKQLQYSLHQLFVLQEPDLLVRWDFAW